MSDDEIDIIVPEGDPGLADLVNEDEPKVEPKQESDPYKEKYGRDFTDLEKEQLDLGWDPTKERTAEEYKKEGELIQSRKRQRELERTLQLTINKVEQIRKESYDKAMADFKAQQREAIRQGDEDSFFDLEKKIEDFKEKNSQDQQDDQIISYVKDFEERNAEWYNLDSAENIAMLNDAQEIEDKLSRFKPDEDVEERLKKVEEAIKIKYPHRFSKENPNRKAPPMVATKSISSRASNTTRTVRLSAADKVRAKMLVDAGIYKNEQEYINDIAMYDSLPGGVSGKGNTVYIETK